MRNVGKERKVGETGMSLMRATCERAVCLISN